MQVSQMKGAVSQAQWKQRIVECRNSEVNECLSYVTANKPIFELLHNAHRCGWLKHLGRVTYYPFVSKTYVGALARESGAKSPCKWGSDSDLCNKEHK